MILPLILALLTTQDSPVAEWINDNSTSRRFSGMSWLDNGSIRVGANLDRGGAITWLSLSEDGVNVVNDHDLGRQIQMSFYSGPSPYEPEGKKPTEVWAGLGWNPIQSGDFAGNMSRVVTHENEGEEIVVRCVPMHWPLDDEPGHCVFESRIRIDGSMVHVRSSLRNDRRDETQYPGRAQELPAVYTNGFLWRLVTYDGDQPFTGDATTTIEKRWSSAADMQGGSPWASWVATEGWAALLNDEGWGLGISTPDTLQYTGGFFGTPGSGGEKDPQTGYFSPLHTEILDADIQYDYEYTLILGTLEEIRAFACVRAPEERVPAWHFERDRRHWSYVHARDTGWPIYGKLEVTLDGPDPQLIGPVGLWRAEEMTGLRIDAAFATGEEHATLYWARHGEGGFRAENALTFPLTPDGTFRTYELDLSAAPTWSGAITRLRLDPASSAAPEDEPPRTVRIRSIVGIRASK